MGLTVLSGDARDGEQRAGAHAVWHTDRPAHHLLRYTQLPSQALRCGGHSGERRHIESGN